jgi:hypothetical protein
MTPWQWLWIEEGDDESGGWRGEHVSREQAIDDAERELIAGTAFLIIEARSSTSMEYEGADCVPFLRTRNRERLVVRQGQR